MSDRTKTKRYKLRHEINRKQRKLRYIQAKNRLHAYPECDYGDFHCDHVMDDPNYPSGWVDFSFFHTKQRRYFAVALQTVLHAAFNEAESRGIDAAIADTPLSLGPKFVTKSGEYKKSKEFKVMEFSDEDLRRLELCKTYTAEFANEEYTITPGIKIVDYGQVAVGVHAIVNRQSIDECVIREFIKSFREQHEEPTKPGWKWEDEEVKIIPGRANGITPTE